MPFSVGSFPNGEDDKGKKFWTNLNFSQILNQIVKGGWFDDNYINTCAFLVRAKLHLADRCSLGQLHSPIYNALLVSFSSVLLSKKSCSWNVKTPHATSTQFLLCNDQLSRNLLFKLFVVSTTVNYLRVAILNLRQATHTSICLCFEEIYRF